MNLYHIKVKFNTSNAGGSLYEYDILANNIKEALYTLDTTMKSRKPGASTYSVTSVKETMTRILTPMGIDYTPEEQNAIANDLSVPEDKEEETDRDIEI